MKDFLLKFIQRGIVGAALGPLVLAVIYGILGCTNVTDTLFVNEVVLGIFSVSFMAFIAAGITVIYQSERLPAPFAALIHGFVLYIDYSIMYLINGWIADGILPFLIFTAIFVVCYALVWLVIYLCIRAKTNKLNKKLNK